MDEYVVRDTIPVGTLLSLMAGTSLEVQMPQGFQKGHDNLIWKRGVAMTAKADDLWDPIPPLPGLLPVTMEDIRHMQNRIHQFSALVPVLEAGMSAVPSCALTRKFSKSSGQENMEKKSHQHACKNPWQFHLHLPRFWQGPNLFEKFSKTGFAAGGPPDSQG